MSSEPYNSDYLKDPSKWYITDEDQVKHDFDFLNFLDTVYSGCSIPEEVAVDTEANE